ncbi:unnamed protein product [Larinioides sclopetarius]|uniref:Uncharacterized protein n=1 Tax=Larinioides sclopetarius TaxID=280406 RepID=A0AAV2AN00_9ARAC
MKQYHDPAKQIKTEENQSQDVLPPEKNKHKGRLQGTHDTFPNNDMIDSEMLSFLLTRAMPIKKDFCRSPGIALGRTLDCGSVCP